MLAPQSIFERILGADFAVLPPPVRHVHALRQPLQTSGRADITVARGSIATLICWLAGLPRPGKDVTTSVLFAPDGNGGERWVRQFASRCYISSFSIGAGPDHNHLIEHFGLFQLQFRLTPSPKGLAWSLGGWRLLGIALPRWSVPRIECLESADGERFTFDIDVTFPLIGWLIHYRGWLAPDGQSEGLPSQRT